MTIPEDVRAAVAEREARMGNRLVDLGRGWQVVDDGDGRRVLMVGTRYGSAMDGVDLSLSPEEAAVLAAALHPSGSG
jgi:hypothetical protein